MESCGRKKRGTNLECIYLKAHQDPRKRSHLALPEFGWQTLRRARTGEAWTTSWTFPSRRSSRTRPRSPSRSVPAKKVRISNRRNFGQPFQAISWLKIKRSWVGVELHFKLLNGRGTKTRKDLRILRSYRVAVSIIKCALNFPLNAFYDKWWN